MFREECNKYFNVPEQTSICCFFDFGAKFFNTDVVSRKSVVCGHSTLKLLCQPKAQKQFLHRPINRVLMKCVHQVELFRSDHNGACKTGNPSNSIGELKESAISRFPRIVQCTLLYSTPNALLHPMSFSNQIYIPEVVHIDA